MLENTEGTIKNDG